ncbi:MAG: kynureninase [Gammaproteobacteria bacterium]|nr:kynureninase [Gammaproteobacteria bacterium]
MTTITKAFFESLDAADPLAPLRGQFDLGDTLYFNGNSLGPPPRSARDRLRQVVESQWRAGLARGWDMHDWLHLPERVGDRIARLIGAAPGEVVAGDSTSVCLFKLAAAALQSTERAQVVTDEANFPTDLYVLSGLREITGRRIEVLRRPVDRIAASVSGQTALVTLTHVNFKTSRMHDMPALTAAAHDHGALILWDLSHSVGAVPLALNACGADLAVGCTYKFLNGGPGAPAFSFVAQRHHQRLLPMLRGWMGHASPFQFSGEYTSASDSRRYAVGTPEVLALSSVDASLEVFDGIDMTVVREKSVRMSGLLMELIEHECGEFGMEIATPTDPAQRGSHVAVRHPEACTIMQALIAENIIGDFRTPDLMRFAIAPLYLRYADLLELVAALRKTVETRPWESDVFRRRATVT